MKRAVRPNRAICITTVLLLLLAIQHQRTQLFGFILMIERWLNEHNRLLLAGALLREQNRRRLRRAPYACMETSTCEWIVVLDTLQRSRYPRDFFPAAA